MLKTVKHYIDTKALWSPATSASINLMEDDLLFEYNHHCEILCKLAYSLIAIN